MSLLKIISDAVFRNEKESARESVNKDTTSIMEMSISLDRSKVKGDEPDKKA